MLKNLGRKIRRSQPRYFVIAFFLAWILWFVTMNYVDPVTYGLFSLELQILNEDALTERSRLILNNRELENITINVHVTGMKSELDNLIPNDTIRASIDINASELIFAPITGQNEPVPVRIDVDFLNPHLTESLQITSIFPRIVDVEIDRLVTIRFDTALIFDYEDLPEGYVALPAELEPRRVSITGPSAIVTQISAAKVGVMVDVTSARDDLTGADQPISAYNEFGDAITGFVMDEEYLDFRLPILRIHTASIALGELAGEVSEDVTIVDVEWEPREIELVGHVDEEQVDVVLDIIDITGITETTSFYVDINKQLARIYEESQKVFALKNPEQNMIEVTVITEPISTLTYVVERDNILISGEAAAARREILTESIKVTLRGALSVLNEVEEVRVIVDAAVLADMPDGEYELPVEVMIPEGTELYGETPTVLIRLLTPEPEPEPDTLGDEYGFYGDLQGNLY